MNRFNTPEQPKGKFLKKKPELKIRILLSAQRSLHLLPNSFSDSTNAASTSTVAKTKKWTSNKHPSEAKRLFEGENDAKGGSQTQRNRRSYNSKSHANLNTTR